MRFGKYVCVLFYVLLMRSFGIPLKMVGSDQQHLRLSGTILETTYEGTKKVKDTKLQMLTTRFGEVKMSHLTHSMGDSKRLSLPSSILEKRLRMPKL